MDEKNAAVLRKILRHIDSVLRYCAPCKSRQDFEREPMRVEATVFNLMQIGELAKSALDDRVKREITSVPWAQIYGLRNRIVHGYSGVNMQIVWDTVSEDLPALREEISASLGETEN